MSDFRVVFIDPAWWIKYFFNLSLDHIRPHSKSSWESLSDRSVTRPVGSYSIRPRAVNSSNGARPAKAAGWLMLSPLCHLHFEFRHKGTRFWHFCYDLGADGWSSQLGYTERWIHQWLLRTSPAVPVPKNNALQYAGPGWVSPSAGYSPTFRLSYFVTISPQSLCLFGRCNSRCNQELAVVSVYSYTCACSDDSLPEN